MPHSDSYPEELPVRTTSSGYDKDVPTAHGSEALLSRPAESTAEQPEPNMQEQLERDVDRR